ncbi:MAG: 2-amino-4-hydroxy-6-hydroxymethyldihydropteridine diphosphokinase, partial [Planctomycetes bacterium]|nr:2-amino-4-hydroxy-6-hydroxymethyldihydropteridine diphosphokinase [Planctomycetota bacterium]
ALVVETSLAPKSLMHKLLTLEKTMGRGPRCRNGPRIIDLDIIFYDDLSVTDSQCTLPHPRFRERGFVLLPLNDIIPGFVDPETGRTIRALLEAWQQAGK